MSSFVCMLPHERVQYLICDGEAIIVPCYQAGIVVSLVESDDWNANHV